MCPMASSTPPIPPVDEVLDRFHPAVAAWVREQFDRPTDVQLRGWDAISSGGHALLGAPTGSGKTLAAFLWGIDQLFREPPPETDRRMRLVYLSPLRALNYDIERNLRAPLQGIRRHAERMGIELPDIRVGVRTGDTPQSERQKQKRTPPDIFITTPESLYVMLTSGTRELFDDVRCVIVDEIHALASSKCGTHMAWTLERLAMRTREANDREPQRIGLSATQRPIERIAAFLGGTGRDVAIIDAPGHKEHDLQVVVPVDDMTAVGSKIVADELEDLDTPTSQNDSYSIWGALHAELLDHVEAHTSTIVFVNSRRLAERLAGRSPRMCTPNARPPRLRASNGVTTTKCACRTTGRRRRSRAPITAPSVARRAPKWRSCSRPVSCRASSRPRAWNSVSTWAPSTSSCSSRARAASRADCSASVVRVTTWAQSVADASTPSIALTSSKQRPSRA